jgi:hypothetical protein
LVLWIAGVLGALMSILWLGYLLLSRRLPSQPLRNWDMLFFIIFFVLTAISIQLTLHFLNISEIHQRRRFVEIGLLLFGAPSLVMNLLSNSWKK